MSFSLNFSAWINDLSLSARTGTNVPLFNSQQRVSAHRDSCVGVRVHDDTTRFKALDIQSAETEGAEGHGSENGQSEAHRPGAITLVRHGEPALSRHVKLDWREYRDWWAKYEHTGLLKGQTPPTCLVDYAKTAGYIYASPLPRAQETAQAVCCERKFESLPILVEAPLPPPKLPFLKLSPKSWGWGFLSRVWWWISDRHDAEEKRRDAQKRAREAAEMLVAKASEGKDVLVLAHGYFNLMVSLELKKMGFVKTVEQGFKYWGCRRYELKPGLESPLMDV
jgi:broad specificity phosphatase PhoE